MFGNHAELFLSGEALFPDLVPTGVIVVPMRGHVVWLRVQRRMHRAVGEIHEERLGRMRRAKPPHHVDGVVGEIVGEVVALWVFVDFDDVVVLIEPMWVVQVGESVEDSVVAIRTPLAVATSASSRRPTCRSPCTGAICQWRRWPIQKL